MRGLESCSRGQLEMCEQSSAKVSDARVEQQREKKITFFACKESSFTLEILVINGTASRDAVLLMLWKHLETSDKIKAL